MAISDDARPSWAPGLALIALTVVAYLPALGNGFIWDDDDYVTGNMALRSLGGLWRIWTQPGATKQFYPLTFTSFWIEYRLWGLAPAGYHLVNVALHAASAVLAWRVLRVLAVPGAWLAAALFAVHPLQVESVAWITERKNTLSGVCYLGAALAYLHFAAGGTRRWRWYGLALALFVAALLSKTVSASLPAVLLLVLWWRGRRLDAATLLPLAPLFALGAGFGMVTAWVERTYVGAVGADWQLSFVERGLIAGRALWFYPGKLLWPHPLIFFYPRWRIDAAAAWQYAFPVAVMIAVGGLWALRDRIGRGPLVAVLCYAAMIFPALGFVDVFPMRYSFVADHFAYPASLPLLALAAAAASTRLAPAVGARSAPYVVGALLLGLIGLTWNATRSYRDIETLWRDTIAKHPGAWMARSNLGLLLAERGDLAGAIAQYRAALDAKPDDGFALNNLGLALAGQGDLDGAVARFRAALVVDPRHAEAHSNLGSALAQQGKLDQAGAAFAAALAIRPRYAEAHNNLANILAMQGRRAEAIAHYRAALEIDPTYDDARRNMNAVLGVPGE